MGESRDFRRILLIKPSSLGDLVHALPVLHGLRQRYPQAHIAWLVSRAFAPLIQGHPELDEVIEFDRNRFKHLGRSVRISREFAAFIKKLRARRFDLAVDLQGLFRSGFLAWSCGAATRVGFRSARELGWVFYTHRLATPDPDMHAVDRNYLVGAVLGFDDVPVTFELGLDDSDRARGAEILSRAGLRAHAPFVAVLPGARWETKRWFADRYATMVARLAEAHGLPAVLMGSSGENELCDRIRAMAGDAAPANIAGQTRLRETVAILDQAAAVVCQDSAPAHLAAALGRPVVCIIGPTNPSRTGPYSHDAPTYVGILRADLPCSPCYFRSLSQCHHAHECMWRVEVAQVVEATLTAVGQSGGAKK